MNLEIKHIPSGKVFISVLLVLGIWGIKQLEFSLFPTINDPRLSANIEIEQPDEFLETFAPVIISRLEQNPNVIETDIRLNGHSATIIVKTISLTNASAQKHIQEHLDEIFNDLLWEREMPVLQADNRHDIPLTELHITTSDFSGLQSWVKHFIIRDLWNIEGIGRLELIGSRKIGIRMHIQAHLPDSIIHTLNNTINWAERRSSREGENWDYPGEKVGNLMNSEVRHGLPMKNLFKVKPVNTLNSESVVRDGNPALILKIFPSENSDILRVNEELEILVQRLSNLHPNYKVSFFNNRVSLVRSEIGSMWVTLLSAVITCLILVRITFSDIRMCLWIIAVLILTICSVALTCTILDVRLNLISIAGIVLGIGILIDNPIIVSETLASSGSFGLRNVWRSLIVSNSTTLLVFIPAIWIVPYAKELFGDMVINILLLPFFSMLFSYLVKPWAAHRKHSPSLSFHKKIYCRSPLSSVWIGVLALTLIISIIMSQYLSFEVLPPIGAQVWKKMSLVPPDSDELENVSHLIYQHNSGILTTVELNNPKVVNLGWIAADDPFQELFRSFETDHKWYRPNADDVERGHWDRHDSQPELTWYIDTTVATLPNEIKEKEIWQNGVNYRWTVSRENPIRTTQLKPKISYRSKVLYRDRKGIYKISADRVGEGGIQSAPISIGRSFLQIIFFTGLMTLFLWMYFGSLRLALIAILAWPISIGGSLIFLVALGDSLNLFSTLAILFTTGVSLNDAVLKIDAFRSYHKGGHSFEDSIELACLYRLRPIFLTSITTLASCLILFLRTGAYDQFNYSVAAAISGGIVFSTIGAIWIIPSLLHLMSSSYRIVQPTA